MAKRPPLSDDAIMAALIVFGCIGAVIVAGLGMSIYYSIIEALTFFGVWSK